MLRSLVGSEMCIRDSVWGLFFNDLEVGDRITYPGSYMWSIVTNNSAGIGIFEITPAFVAPEGPVDFLVQQITAETIHYGSTAFGYPGGSFVQGFVTVDSGTPVQDTTAYPIELLRQAVETSDDWQILTTPPSNRPSTSPQQPQTCLLYTSDAADE